MYACLSSWIVFSLLPYGPIASRCVVVYQSPLGLHPCDRSLSLVDHCPDINIMSRKDLPLHYPHDRGFVVLWMHSSWKPFCMLCPVSA